MTDDTAMPIPAAPGTLVLVADDDDDIRSLIVDVLQHAGIGVVAVSDGAAAVQAVIEHGAALRCAILDVRMPVLNGIAAARAIREIAPNLAIVIMSGDFPPGYRQQLAPLRPAHVLDKPFRLGELRGLVQGISAAA